MSGVNLKKYSEALKSKEYIDYIGKVSKVVGLTIESDGPQVSIGNLCNINIPGGNKLKAEVVGFRDEKVLLMPWVKWWV